MFFGSLSWALITVPPTIPHGPTTAVLRGYSSYPRRTLVVHFYGLLLIPLIGGKRATLVASLSVHAFRDHRHRNPNYSRPTFKFLAKFLYCTMSSGFTDLRALPRASCAPHADDKKQTATAVGQHGNADENEL